MNKKRDPQFRQKQQMFSNVITMLAVYLISGTLIVYGGVNVSINTLGIFRGVYTEQWQAALPFIFLFGLLPIVGGVLLLVLHPATRNPPK